MTRRMWMLAGGGLMLMVLGATVWGCRSSGDLRGGGPAALAATDDVARRAMVDASQEVEAGLDRFLALFDTFETHAVADASRKLYAVDAYFNDGFVELEGSEAIADYLARSAGLSSSLTIDVEELVRTESGVYVRWLMHFTTTGGREVHAPGISHLRFSPDGRIVYHRDYWDASGALASMVPMVGPILNAVRKRL